MSIPDQSKKQLGRPIGRIPSGVYILTAAHNGVHQAMMASWVQQASFEPPCVSVALARARPIGIPIRDSKRFALSILGQEDAVLMKKYARGIPEGEDPFAGVRTVQTPSGLMAIADALAWLDCRVQQACDFGADHELLVAQITAGQLLKEGQPFTHVRGNGFHY
jgi:flavin reductase (DIM6/NTAB) family NADH-FMN oxidoreductase RutF